ncbi:MAG: response regulator [SAR324 cluster bacterium]|nr:response regulator [SAR324 cluster bacterium]
MRIMLVDDEFLLVQGISEGLTDNGHQVTQAENGKQAYQIFAEAPESFDLIITDIKMPVMDGLELLKKVHRLDVDMPVIIITGHGDLEISIEALRLGALDFMLKPVKMKHLYLAIAKLERIRRFQENFLNVLPFVDPVRISIPSQMILVDGVTSWIRNYLHPLYRKHGISVNEISIVVTEALTNAIVHGNLEIPSSLKEESLSDFQDLVSRRETEFPYTEKKVSLSFQISPEKLEMKFEDEGKGFDYSKLPNYDDSAAMMLSGRGLLLIHSFVDQMIWNEKGNSLKIVKNLPKKELHHATNEEI